MDGDDNILGILWYLYVLCIIVKNSVNCIIVCYYFAVLSRTWCVVVHIIIMLISSERDYFRLPQ